METHIRKGLLIVLSGPSGVGKGTVCKALLQKKRDLIYSVSATTRKPRVGEIEGVNYFFISHEQFQRMIKMDRLLEYAEYVGHYYGTPCDFVEQTLAAGQDVILEIEVQGAMKVKQKYPEGIFIFLLPPSLAVLQERIQERGTEQKRVIAHRMDVAMKELALVTHYHYAVVNDEIDSACRRIESIIIAEHCKIKSTD